MRKTLRCLAVIVSLLATAFSTFTAKSAEYYLRGTFNDWDTSHQLIQQSDDIYTITVDDLSGNIKVADAGWSTDATVWGSNGARLKCGEPYTLGKGKSTSNIEIKGGIKNAKVTFDAAAGTLLIEGDYYAIPLVIEGEVYVYGDFNDWKAVNPLTKGEDGIYRTEIEGFEKRFKIADADYNPISYGGDNVTLCQDGIPYNLVKKGKNITLAQKFNKALVEVDFDELTVTVTDLEPTQEVTLPHSGTIPVMYINSATEFTSLDRETYVAATYYIDNCGVEWAKSIGSEEAPLPLQLKGRGNYTWLGFDKKPLRLLLDEDQEVLGLKKNNYFGLFAHADDDLGFMRNLLGFEIARSLNMDWTPSQQPVEVYYNGEYRGLYFCTELVRVEPDRVNLKPQADNDDTDVTGGWMCEIDNYDTDPHITLTEGNGEKIIVSRKMPLELSEAQEAYITDQMETINRLVYDKDKSNCQWAEYVDLDHLARFYVVNEIMDDYESFHGSCLLHKDAGEGSKWKWGPVWDFGSSFKRGQGKFIWKDAKWSQIWIGEMYKFPEFQEAVKKVWAEFCANEYDKLEGFLTDYVNLISEAAAKDFLRWPAYGNDNLQEDLAEVLYRVRNKSRWLGAQWGTAPDDVAYEAATDAYLRGTFNNWETTHKMTKQADGTFTIKVDDLNGDIKIADADWSDMNYGSNGSKLSCGVLYKMVAGSGSDNIEINGGIKNAIVTFDPEAETLLITGDYYAIDQEEEDYVIYLRGTFNSWSTDNQLLKGDDGIYRAEVENFGGHFKIADSGYSKVNLGGDNVTDVVVGVPYPLVKKGKNANLAETLAKALVEVDMNLLTVLVTEIGNTPSEVTTIEVDDTLRIFNLQGVEMNPKAHLAPGIYIEVRGSKARKVMK